MDNADMVCPVCGLAPQSVCVMSATLACPNWCSTRNLDCPVCDSGVPALRWHEPDSEHPVGEYIAYVGDVHVCRACGWELVVGEFEDRARLDLLCCPHGLQEGEPCWRCEAVEWCSILLVIVWLWMRQAWCGLRGRHDWKMPSDKAAEVGALGYCRNCRAIAKVRHG